MNSSNARVPLFLTPIISTSGKWRLSWTPCCWRKRYFGFGKESLSFNAIPVRGTIRTIEPKILISGLSVSFGGDDVVCCNGFCNLKNKRKNYFSAAETKLAQLHFTLRKVRFILERRQALKVYEKYKMKIQTKSVITIARWPKVVYQWIIISAAFYLAASISLRNFTIITLRILTVSVTITISWACAKAHRDTDETRKSAALLLCTNNINENYNISSDSRPQKMRCDSTSNTFCGNMRYSYGRREHIRSPPHGIAWGKLKYEIFRDIMRCAAYDDILFFTRFALVENHECWAAIDTFFPLAVWVKRVGMGMKMNTLWCRCLAYSNTLGSISKARYPLWICKIFHSIKIFTMKRCGI